MTILWGIIIRSSYTPGIKKAKCLEVRQEVLYFSMIRVRVRAGSGYIVKYRLPDL